LSVANLQFIITSPNVSKRLDKFLFNELKDKSRSFIQQAISQNDIVVNNKHVKNGYKLKLNDVINVQFKSEPDFNLNPENIPLEIVFEDDFILVVDKPSGLVVHPGAGNRSGTLVNALLYYCNNLSTVGGKSRPGIVHRLDKETSGLIVVAKNDLVHQKLQEQFLSKDIHRTYNALVWGVPPTNVGEIETLITRSRKDRKKMSVSFTKGKEAITQYKLIQEFTYLSLIELKLNTGRTHQIRVHLNHSNMPVFGDPVYNGRKSQLRRLPSHLQKRGASLLKQISRQALHAKELTFIHPLTKKRMIFESQLPDDFKNILNKISEVLMLN
jgi:23S rRNA pseudouridine1911/1915/1917 synthase